MQDAATTHDWLVRLSAELVQHRLDALVDTMADAVRVEVPPYAELPRTAGFREGLRRTATAYCRTLAERRRMNDNEVVALHVIGSQRARLNLVPNDVLAAVDVALRVGWKYALRQLRDLGADADTVEAVSADAFPLTLAFATDVREGLLCGFRADTEDSAPAHVRAQAAVIDRLLVGAATDEDLYEAARSRSLDIRPPCGLLVVTAVTGSDTALRASATALGGLPRVFEGPSRFSSAPPHVVLVASAVSAWPTLLATLARVAPGTGALVVAADAAVDKLVDLASSYEALTEELPFARRARRRPGLVLRRELGLYRALSHIPPGERVELVIDTLGPVLEKGRKGETYLRAYEAWLEAEGDFSQAAESLREAVHTVRYRVKMTEDLCGAAKSADGRTRLDIAFRL